ncbi:MAG: hypothetical protein R3343_07900, partial [Nitriliruptorales bacterium]|nr:hypothetical protein [Nitriliruptorales bacterium]
MPPPSTVGRRLVAALVGLLAIGCSQGGLDPRGSEADRIFDITVWLTIAGVAVFVIVVVAFVVAVWSRGEEGDHRTETVEDTRLERRFVIAGGIVMPAVILAGFFGVQIWSTMQQPQSGELT